MADRFDDAVCCPVVCPLLVRFCGVAEAPLCTWPPILDNDCSEVLSAPMTVLTCVMVSENAEMFDSCARAAIAKPSSGPMPA